MATGTVKWFNTQKGYGFIQPDQGDKDIFVHISAVERSELGSLAEGQKVGFELQRDRKTGRESAVDLREALARASTPLRPMNRRAAMSFALVFAWVASRRRARRADRPHAAR